jgi:hypothetical protein
VNGNVEEPLDPVAGVAVPVEEVAELEPLADELVAEAPDALVLELPEDPEPVELLWPCPPSGSTYC